MSTPQKPPKKVGRPSIGVDEWLGVRVSPELMAEIDAWAEAHNVKRSEAARQLLALGLKRK